MNLAQRVASYVLVLGCIVGLTGCKSTDKNTEVLTPQNSVTTVIISYEDKEHSIMAVSDGVDVEYRYLIDGDLTNKFKGDYTTDLPLKLPDPKDGYFDITQIGLIAENTYDMDIQKSAMYIAQLENSGYSLKMKAETPKFIEVYLENSQEGIIKRLIITPNYTVISDVSQIPYLKIEDYLFK